MRNRRCIKENGRWGWGSLGEWIQDPPIWHILPTGWKEPEADFAPILCSSDEGITLPSWPVTRQPTCPDCIAIATEAHRR